MLSQLDPATELRQPTYPEPNLPSRLYFDLSNGLSTNRDLEGVLAADLDEAIMEAQAIIGEMHVNGELSEDAEGWMLVIKDASGEALMTLPIVPGVQTPALAS